MPILLLVAALVARLLFPWQLRELSEFLLTEQAVASFAEEVLTGQLPEGLLSWST